MPKCFTGMLHWDTSLCPYIKQRPWGAVTDTEIQELGLNFTCAGSTTTIATRPS
jgi:hypothetical protein